MWFKIVRDIVILLPSTLFFSKLRVWVYNLKNDIQIDKSVRIDRNVSISGNVIIKENTSIAQGTIISTGPGSVEIGSNVMIAPNVSVIAFNHGTDTTELKRFQKLIATHVTVGDDVWIGISSIVIGNCEILEGAVIGAGSVVTTSIPPYTIAVGIPAREIKKL
jgi:acetyltransferase-like isoleucine patch superfamily enzyme